MLPSCPGLCFHDADITVLRNTFLIKAKSAWLLGLKEALHCGEGATYSPPIFGSMGQGEFLLREHRAQPLGIKCLVTSSVTHTGWFKELYPAFCG